MVQFAQIFAKKNGKTSFFGKDQTDELAIRFFLTISYSQHIPAGGPADCEVCITEPIGKDSVNDMS